MREKLDHIPEGVLVQFGPRGSYRLEHTIDFYEWLVVPATSVRTAGLYLHDWYAPNLDDSVGDLFENKGHGSTCIAPNTTGQVQVPDTHAHMPLNKYYKNLEMKDAELQLRRGAVMPSVSAQTVLERAASAYDHLDLDKISFGFVTNGIANDLFGSQDEYISKECKPFWDANDMPARREEARKWVEDRFNKKEFKDWAKDIRKPGFQIPYPGYDLPPWQLLRYRMNLCNAG